MTERQGSQRDMASVNIRTRRRPSVPCGTWTGESSVVGLSVLTTQPARKTKRSSKVSNYSELTCFISCIFAKLQLCFFCLLWHRFGNRSPHHRVSLWRQHPATGSPRVHQQSCGQSAAWADVWTDETDEGRLEERLGCSSIILIYWHNKSVDVAFPKRSGSLWLGYSSSTPASHFKCPSGRTYINII